MPLAALVRGTRAVSVVLGVFRRARIDAGAGERSRQSVGDGLERVVAGSGPGWGRLMTFGSEGVVCGFRRRIGWISLYRFVIVLYLVFIRLVNGL